MASRIMHYAIADILTKKINIKDYNRFIFGALAPDMSRHDDGSYDIAHIGKTNEAEGVKGIDWISFYHKYEDKILNDDFFIGYYVHLIVDAYWLKHIQNEFIRKYTKEEKSVLYTKGYRDMYNYNKLLIDKYNLVNKVEIIENIQIDEIDKNNVHQYMRDFRKDFQSEKIDNIKFEVYPYEDIMSFIQNACEKCIREITAIIENKPLGKSEELFVKI